MKLFYSFGVWLYTAAVYVASAWNPKARKWVQGRREAPTLLNAFSLKQTAEIPVYWFHCASLGEFEQARPLIEALKSKSACKIAISFFSPSGYEIRKNYELADIIFYLLVDSKKNARLVFDTLKPTAVFFIKYEFWAQYIFEAKKREIPFYSVSAVFRENQIFFKGYGDYMRRVLKACTAIFVQDERSQKLLSKINVESILSGDTRYDRVMKNTVQAKRFEKIDLFAKDVKIFVCGSLWNPDLSAVSKRLGELGNGWKIILTTHEIGEEKLKEAERFFSTKKIIRYSKLTAENADADVLLIDNIGMLMHVYGYGSLAYVGGAFKTGLHNILEPASFGLPVIFGPNHQKFPEAKLFIDQGIGFSISNEAEFEKTLTQLQQQNLRERVIGFMHSQTGATDRILEKIG